MRENVDLPYQFVEKIKALPFVEQILLFGSRARGDNQPRSDIDLAILTSKASEDDWVSVMNIIENADTLLKIDCVRVDKLKSDDPLKLNIIKDNKILFNRREK